MYTAYNPLKPSLERIMRTALGAEANCPVCILCLTTWKYEAYLRNLKTKYNSGAEPAQLHQN